MSILEFQRLFYSGKIYDGTTVNMISEYCSAGRESRMEASQNISKEELPFFNGKPYMISADSMMPEAFRRMFEVQKMKAGLFLPIDVSGKTGNVRLLLRG